MTPEDKAYYSNGYQPLFNLMIDEWKLHLLESEMTDIINCVRKMDEAHGENINIDMPDIDIDKSLINKIDENIRQEIKRYFGDANTKPDKPEKMTIQEARERYFPGITKEDLERLADSYKDKEGKK